MRIARPIFRSSKGMSRASKLRVVPDSKEFDLAVFYRIARPCSIAISWAAVMKSRPSMASHARRHSYRRISTSTDVRIGPESRKMARFEVRAEPRTHPRQPLDSRPASGVKSLKLAQDAEVEIKAGSLYRKRCMQGVPLVFDTGDIRRGGHGSHHLAERADSERNEPGHEHGLHAMRKRNAFPVRAR